MKLTKRSSGTLWTEPLVVDGGHAVAGAEDDVDEVVAAPRLAEPVRKRQLRLAPRRGQRRQHPFDVARVHEDVEVLRVPRDPRVTLEGVGAPDEELEAGLVQQAHRAQVEVASGGRQRVVAHGMVAPMPAPAWTGGGAEGGTAVGPLHLDFDDAERRVVREA